LSLLTQNPVRGGVWVASRELSWTSLVTRHRPWVAAAFAVCALYGVGIALVSTDFLHRDWGIMAASGYGLGAIAVLAWRSRGADLALALSLCGAVLVPLAWMATAGQGQPEVYVIMKSALMLVHQGTPYVAPSLLNHTTNPDVYNPYLPLMSVFALLWTVAPDNPLADPRIWFGVVFVACFALALRVAKARDVARWTVFVTATPIIALELTVGGTDVPIIALICLGFALMWKYPRPILAGLAFGGAASMKATAWPAVVIAISLALARDGKRSAAIMTGVALGVVAVLVGPFAALQPESLVKNTISFPLGLASVASQAVSPLPGHLIAETGHIGRLCVIAALVLVALAIGASLIFRPPKTVPAAVTRLVVALAVMFVLAPATRFGYFIYPGAILAWLLLSLLTQPPAVAPDGLGPPPDPVSGPLPRHGRPRTRLTSR
jgi:Glycosyltransferase family 87